MDRLTSWNGKKWVLPQGMWREIADRLAAFENIGLEPEEITERLRGDNDDEATQGRRWDTFTAVIIERGKGGNVPFVDPVNCCAYLSSLDVEANADNAAVIHEKGANHLVIEVYPDHWHVAQVGGYTAETGLFTKLY